MTTSTPITIKTRSKAPFAIVYTGEPGRAIEAAVVGYAYTYEAAAKRARRMSRFFVVAPIVGGKVEVERPAV